MIRQPVSYGNIRNVCVFTWEVFFNKISLHLRGALGAGSEKKGDPCGFWKCCAVLRRIIPALEVPVGCFYYVRAAAADVLNGSVVKNKVSAGGWLRLFERGASFAVCRVQFHSAAIMLILACGKNSRSFI